jgi:hypothetical protein
VFDSTDLFFYDYPSTRQRAAASAHDLGAFVADVLTNGPYAIAARGSGLQLKTGAPRRYREVLFVGHSLGGVVVRWWLADRAGAPSTQHKAFDDIVLHTSPVLFAPAIGGFLHDGLISTIAGKAWPLSLVLALWEVRASPAYVDLKTRSPSLDSLRDRTVSALAKSPAHKALRARILFGLNDNVVHIVQYPEDSRSDVRDKAHLDVCKPDESYLQPMEEVINGLAKSVR